MRRAAIDDLLFNDPAIRNRLANRPSLCYGTNPRDGQRVSSPTDNHISAILKESYATGRPIPPWCVWCGQSL